MALRPDAQSSGMSAGTSPLRRTGWASEAMPPAARIRATPSANWPPTLILVDDKTDKAWLSDARAKYPIDTCVVSGERLDDHAESKRLDIIYREPGKPDRLVRFCCKGCITDFEKDP